MATTDSGRAEWIDAAKCLAIFAVMFDHANGLAFPSTKMVVASYFSVSLFVFVMGVTSFWSFREHGGTGGGLKRCWKIFRPYLVATFVYCVFRHRAFDLEVFLNHVIRFDASGPLYYVLLYMQLLVAAPFLFRTCGHSGRKALFTETATFAGVLVLSAFATNRTNILGVYGGGGKLFGGTYLALLYLGMLFGKYSPQFAFSRRQTILALTVVAGTSLAWLALVVPNRKLIDCMFPFGNGKNPPSFCLMTYALLVALSCFCAGKAVESTRSVLVRHFFRQFSRIGRHTLYIFLYHRLFLDSFYSALCHMGLAKRILPVLSGVLFFALMTIGSIFLEKALERPFRPANVK